MVSTTPEILNRNSPSREEVVLEVVQGEILEVPLEDDRRYGNGLKSRKKCLPTSVPFTEGGTGDSVVRRPDQRQSNL